MARGTKKRSRHDDALHELRAFGLAYPGAHYKSPWPGHMDLAVNDKTFAYLSLEGEPLGISCKLPHSCTTALMLPFTKPTAYGLGRSGWVSASFEPSDDPPVDMLREWIDESYRAQAPKRLLEQLDDDKTTSSRSRSKTTAKPARTKKTAKKSAARKPTTKKSSAKKSSPKKPPAKKRGTRKSAAKKSGARRSAG